GARKWIRARGRGLQEPERGGIDRHKVQMERPPVFWPHRKEKIQVITATQRRRGTNGTAPPLGTVRVGYYTRISTYADHQKYSLDAQKDRLDAYSTSQYG